MNFIRDFERFPFLKDLEENWEGIRDEYLMVSHRLWLHPVKDRYNQGWKFLSLYEWGKPNADNCKHCPLTARIVKKIPSRNVVGFSKLSPRTHIFPHAHPKLKDARGAKYITYGATCHLGLVVPNYCFFRVGSEVKKWKEGESFIFDPTIIHEAWSESQQDRIILFIDFETLL